ncbi:hypothetical protein JB92DRAFT_2795307 [Gautieria morchelliformis]|nr:hypothetical protein JB92DRAFT_2795307 [Gautieria morchelliformis]
MVHPNGLDADTLEKHQHEVCNAFARAAVAMRDAAHTAENFSNWFSRVNNLQNIPVPPMFNESFHTPSSLTATGKKRKLSGDQEGKKKRPVKEKKPKDVNAPKRPPSAYLLFQNEVRKQVKAEHPEMPHNQLLAEVSKLWAGMDEKDKEPYMQATKDSKVLYEKAKADYDANPKKPTETTEATGASTKPPTAKSKTPAAVKPSVEKSVVKPTPTSNDDDDDEEEEESSSPSSDTSSEDDEDEEEAPQPAPEPPRKKSKREAVKTPTPPPVKVDKKKKTDDGKKKKKNDT